MTVKKVSTKDVASAGKSPAARKEPRVPKVMNPETAPGDSVPFRPTLDPFSLDVIKQLGQKWHLKGSPTVLKIIDQFIHKKVDSEPLVEFIRDKWPTIEPIEISSKGVLYIWEKRTHDSVRALAWDNRWSIGGNMSKMLRIMIYFTALKEGIRIPKR